MTDLEGALLFAGVPLAIVAVVFTLVFRFGDKPGTDPITRPVMDEPAGGRPAKRPPGGPTPG